MTIPAIRFENVSRQFGDFKAVDQINLDVNDQEFFTFLGPSGSGKTTCLRMVAGFEIPSSGQIRLYGQDVSNLPPYQRDVNTVFQDYALFPHMTVAANVGYGLMIKGMPHSKREKEVEAMLNMVELGGLGGRKPGQLSGGQRQRVALARALINQPRVLLLDEPLGALDLKLRQQMQLELKTIQQKVGITFIYVTHDQEEALTMSDRVAVFNKGKIEQVGTPSEIYENPATPFVAGFVGTSNIISGDMAQKLTGSSATFSVRPEKIHLNELSETISPTMYSAEGKIMEVVYLGLYTRYLVALDLGMSLIVVEQNLRTSSNQARSALAKQVRVSWEKEHTSRLG